MLGIPDMFRNSVELYGIRFKFDLGDGDSSAFATVEKAKPYGEEFEIVKKECIGHKCKNGWGHACARQIKNLLRRQNNRRKGAAYQAMISILYYGLAIRRNCSISVQAVKAAI